LIDGNEIVLAGYATRDIGQAQECLSVAGCSDFEIVRNQVHHCDYSSSQKGGEGIDAKLSLRGSIHDNPILANAVISFKKKIHRPLIKQ
jgi:hypothetical protein